MLILLPPSETKRDGGDETEALLLSRLHFLGLTRQRRAMLAALRSLGRNQKTMSEALGLSPAQRFEVVRNRTVRSSPVMPAIERYTGVLFDTVDLPSFTPAERAFADRTIAIHSALFGLVLAEDPIPAYRLSYNSRVPGIHLRALWREAVSSEIRRQEGFVLDLRSEGYVGLGPVPASANGAYVRVVSVSGDGTTRALNHLNKTGKGELVRALVAAGIEHPDASSLLKWAAGAGVNLVPGVGDELSLVV